MTNMSIQPLWLTYFIEILLVIELQLTQFIVGAFSYKAHFRPQISSNGFVHTLKWTLFDLKTCLGCELAAYLGPRGDTRVNLGLIHGW